MLKGTVNIAERAWDVLEEKRAGPQSQLFVLTAADSPASRMHVRPLPGTTVKELGELEVLAADAQIRWFEDHSGTVWETRLVLHSEPNAKDSWRVKFISDENAVVEGPYQYKDGLGRRTDEELAALLQEAG